MEEKILNCCNLLVYCSKAPRNGIPLGQTISDHNKRMISLTGKAFTWLTV
jgi:hypothetical protein